MMKFSLIFPTNIKIAVVGNINNFLAIRLMGHDRSDHRAYYLPLKPTVFVISLRGCHYNGNMYNFQLCIVCVHNFLEKVSKYQDFYEGHLGELLLYMRVKKISF